MAGVNQGGELLAVDDVGVVCGALLKPVVKHGWSAQRRRGGGAAKEARRWVH
jgi:hypothetical protein